MRASIPLLALALFPAGLGAQLSESKALSQLKAAFRGAKSAAELERREAALAALQGHDSPKVVKALIHTYRQLDQEAGPLVASRQGILARGGGVRPLRPLRDALQPVHNLQEIVLRRLGALESPASAREMVENFIRPRRSLPLSLRLCLAEATGRLDDSGLRQLLETPKDRGRNRTEHRVLYCRALAAAGRRAAFATPQLLAWLEEDEPELRKAVYESFAALCAPRSLKPLIEALDRERGRLRDQLLETLCGLTGSNPGIATSSWRQWLAAEGHEFLSGKKPLGRAGRARVAPLEKRGEKQGTGAYFGIPQDGAAILYVFDNSNSMQATMPRTTGQTRMQRCKQELKKALRALSPDKTFNLLCFANRLRQFEDRMQPATKTNVEAACAWVDKIEMQLHTNSYDALEQAFYLAGRGTADRHYPLAADTIFFLSDGAPTRPGQGRGLGRDDVGEILAAVRRWNGLRRVVIHTIGLGLRGGKGRQQRARQLRGNGPRGFMHRLAAQNGGQFVEPQ